MKTKTAINPISQYRFLDNVISPYIQYKGRHGRKTTMAAKAAIVKAIGMSSGFYPSSFSAAVIFSTVPLASPKTIIVLDR